MVSLVTKNTASVQHVLISEDQAGQRIDNFLLTYLKGVPKTRVYRSVRTGEVRVNKGRVKPDYRIQAGDSIRIPPIAQANKQKPNFIPSKLKANLADQILYEDDDLLILNKPAGLAVHGGSGINLGLIEALRNLKPELPGLELIHRLDRDTSGCLLIAKKRSALRFVQEQLRTGHIEKKYIALVKGKWKAGKIIDAPLRKNQLSSGERMVRVDWNAKPSKTEFKVLKSFGNSKELRSEKGAEKEKSSGSAKTVDNAQPIVASLMEIKLLTGRTHQIRVHTQYAGHPIAGDVKYGDSHFNQLMKTQGLSRLFLHANSISFDLPKSKKRFTIDAPLDNSLTHVLEQLS